jgi:hypothetical protein
VKEFDTLPIEEKRIFSPFTCLSMSSFILGKYFWIDSMSERIGETPNFQARNAPDAVLMT